MNNIYDYMRSNGTLLGDRILETFPPLQEANDPLSPRLTDLVRPPLPAQAVAIQALSKFLKNGDAAKIVSECGTGKTLMALATTYVHSNGRPYSTLIMCPPHLILKWVRETFLTVPNCRVFLIEDMRNLSGHEPKKPHGVIECKLKDGQAVRKGDTYSLSALRQMGRKQWLKSNPFPTFFIMGRDRGKLGYFWRHAPVIGQTGVRLGAVLNPESYERVASSDGGFYSSNDFFDNKKKKVDEIIERPNGGTSIFAPLWSADRSKILRMAPVEFIGRYMKNWFDYSIADEVHQLAGDTAQGNALGALALAGRKSLALTGTLLGGYADDIFNVLYRMDAPQMIKEGFAWGGEGRMDFVRQYGVIETVKKEKEDDNACSRRSKKSTTVKRRPGASPMLFGKFLMSNTAFVSLEDIASELPPYDEEVIEVAMEPRLETAYKEVEEAFKHAVLEYKKSGSVISLMLNTLLLYPDHPFDLGTIKARVYDKESDCFVRVPIITPQDLNESSTFSKEDKLVEEIKADLAKGRRCQVFVTYTGAHSVLHRIEKVLVRAGIRTSTMEASLPTEKREAWYESQVAKGTQVVVCHPKLVETGLDLLNFPTLIFYETGYSLHTLRQASRRSWRIGQKLPVVVKFIYYKDTMQEQCLKLMGKKMLVALAMEGKFSGEGLQAMGDEDLMTALARELVNNNRVGESADKIWHDLREQRQKVLGVPASPTVAAVIDVPVDAITLTATPINTTPINTTPINAPIEVPESLPDVPHTGYALVDFAASHRKKKPGRRASLYIALEESGQIPLFG
jgi:superfamily II DNA or RNA helicase